ncbi:DUF2244 domain-containing protein [Nereida sp. MMG025]|uniref:DUF2244 domain-containing protein n=1 Tax=Nereida sp. MMG025 TaxID=2909981 RepID=UPI001F26710A|nr:DUF2244 domain-containing protein [Nereida sp. MMG025]MCF6443774.1 DUF2244 domain-containing protein [Nereida sp. MMG025]
MPYQTTSNDPTTVTLWPHQSMTPNGFVVFIGITAGLIALPLIAILGSPVLWGLLPFFAIALWGIWFALRRNQRDGNLREDLIITPETCHLRRQNPRKGDQTWDANTYWVSVHLHETGGPVENYVTLKGGLSPEDRREVEIGAFLSPDERKALYGELQSLIRATL